MGRRLCSKISNEKVLTDDSLPLDCAWHLSMYLCNSWKFILEARIEREHPYICLRVL